MTINTKFDDLTLVEHGLILKNGKNVKREISFSEIADIYVKTDKLKPVYKLGLISAFSACILVRPVFVTRKGGILGFFSRYPGFCENEQLQKLWLEDMPKRWHCFQEKDFFEG